MNSCFSILSCHGEQFPQGASSQMFDKKIHGIKFVQIKKKLCHWKDMNT
jgi:hypothetical protein